MRQLQTNSHSKNLIMYHLIFVSKYRRKVFLNKDFAENLKSRFYEIAKKYDFSIDSLELDYSKPDHVHVLVRSLPKLSPLQIVRILKQQTNIWAWKDYEKYLKTIYWKARHMWTRGYFCASVGNVSAENIAAYLEKQGRNEL